jgi:hypothetical protein
MKVLLSILFSASLLFAGGSVSGQVADTLVVSGNFRNSPVIGFLDKLTTEYSISFYYDPERLNNVVINQTFLNTPVEEAVALILKETPYRSIRFQDAYIVIPREEEKDISSMSRESYLDSGIYTLQIGNPDEAGRYKTASITGHITDGATGDPLESATIQVSDTRFAAVSDRNGKYSITLSPGLYKLKISCIGFDAMDYNIKLISSGNLDVTLNEESILIDGVVIKSRRADHNVTSNQMSLIEVNREAIQQLTLTIGTKDIIRSMTLMPGVKSAGEFGSDIIVRGGGSDQNLILIEGAPVFNTAHIFGLLSVVNADALESAVLYKGNIPARFGERVSSVMDLKIRQDNDEIFWGTGGIGIIDSRLTLGIPIIKKKLSVLVGGRTTYSDYLLHLMPDTYLKNSSAYFFDMNGLITYNINKANELSLSGYRSYDLFDYVHNLKYDYGNTLGSIKWSHKVSNRLHTNLQGSYSNYKINRYNETNVFEKTVITSELSYASARLNATYTFRTDDNLDFGVQSIFYRIQPGSLSPLDEASVISPFKLNPEQALENAIYIAGKFELGSIISINAGLRYSYYDFRGPDRIYIYESESPRITGAIIDSVSYEKNEVIKTYSGIEPRISLKFQLNSSSSVKLNYNRANQYISLVSYSAVPTPDDRWKLSDPFVKPVICDQVAIGYYKNFRQNLIETSLEVYYKKLQNLVEYKNGAQILLNPYLETALLNASGESYGVEFFIKKSLGSLDGWFGYTWSRSLKKTSGIYEDEIINDNTWYPSSFDIPHDLTLMATYHLNRRWQVSGTFKYNSGRAITLPENKYIIDNEYVIQFSERNKYRLPDYHRLDLSITMGESLRAKKKWKGSWTLAVINVYGRDNAYSVFYEKHPMSAQNNFRLFSLNKLYIIGQPIPTLTYNFNF